jgi:hypothetical protein
MQCAQCIWILYFQRIYNFNRFFLHTITSFIPILAQKLLAEKRNFPGTKQTNVGYDGVCNRQVFHLRGFGAVGFPTARLG